MIFQPLAPRPSRSPGTENLPSSQPVFNYSSAEWEMIRPVFKRLYVTERRKLRFIIRYMEEMHGFKASAQMYKKRIAKWGYHKNSSSSSNGQGAIHGVGGRSTQKGRVPRSQTLPSILIQPERSCDDSLTYKLLFGVRSWSESFFESRKLVPDLPPCDSAYLIRKERAKSTCYALRLALDLLDSGKGDLAGRMVRRAFLNVEEMLMLESPALVWNLLDIMHSMVRARQNKLFYLLLTHIIELKQCQMSPTHPLLVSLRAMQSLVLQSGSKSSKASSMRNEDCSRKGPDSASNTQDLSSVCTHHIERAWFVNAEILMDHVDAGFPQLHCGIIWDECQLLLSNRNMDKYRTWLKQYPMRDNTKGQDTSIATVGLDHDKEEIISLNLGKEGRQQFSFESLRDTSLMAIAKLMHPEDGSPGPAVDPDSITSPYIITALIGPRSPNVVNYSERFIVDQDTTVEAKRLQVSLIAWLIKVLIELGVKQARDSAGDMAMGDIERVYALIALQEYAHGYADPQVIRTMWLLEEMLQKEGRFEEAQMVRQESYARAEQYVEDICPNSW